MQHESVTTYVEGLTSPWPRAHVEDVIAAIRAAGSFDEAIKWGHPYFAHDGRAVVKLFVAQQWINVYFFRGTELADPEQLLEPDPRARMRKLRLLPDRLVHPGITALVSAARSLS